MSAVGQTAATLDVPKPEWDNQLFQDLHEALPEDRKAEFQACMTTFNELGKQLQSAIKEHEQGRLRAEKSCAESDCARTKLDERELDLRQREDELIQRTSELERSLSELSSRELRLDEAQLQKESELLSKERDLEAREANARAGFVAQNRTALEQLRAEIDGLEKERLSLQSESEQRRRAASEDIRQEAQRLRDDLESGRREVDEKEAELAAEKALLDQQRRRLDISQRSRDHLEVLIRKQIQDESAADLEAKQEEIRKLEERGQRLAADLNAANDRLDEYAEMAGQLKGRSPAKVLDELDDLRRDGREKDLRIRELEDAQTRDDSAALRSERDHLLDELRNLRPELEELKQRDHLTRLGVLEKEQWATEKRLLERNKELLSAHLNDLESRIKGLTDAQQNQGAFPELGRMDMESRFQTPASVHPVGDLKTFTDELQHRIAATQPQNPLFFRIEDLQLFVGGLAMSQLHVLQGISGTGKTSLAKAFAEAVGGECTDIAVQAGWRDRADLLGHYNAFERRYYEKDCLQALYKAQTPYAADRLNVILLDEMNLSRPEQYFADFLSALEKKPGHRKVTLLESAPSNHPRNLWQGREIELPENVWFIGTANQDETTNELADKTHDRAFVMELPRHEKHFAVRKGLAPARYDFRTLKELFSQAQKTEEAEVMKALRFIGHSELTKVLEERFDRGWGNRFERQALKFLPVVKAAGGSFATALDHLLASRIFRAGKVTGRYDIKKDDLEAIAEALVATLSQAFPGMEAKRCLMAIEKDIKRLERGG